VEGDRERECEEVGPLVLLCKPLCMVPLPAAAERSLYALVRMRRTQAELERKLANADARRVMAEEQLEGMQKYLTQSTVQYQREIVRLRSVIGQLDPRMLKANPLKGTGGGGGGGGANMQVDGSPGRR
jgi:hypothetical protein